MSVMGFMHLSLPFCLLLSELNEQRHLIISSDPAATAATTEMENPTQASISASPQSLSEREKLLQICRLIQDLNMTPKSFIISFLESGDSDLAYRRRFWGTQTGWHSTSEVLRAIKSVVCRTQHGATGWKEFIKEEAIEIMINQEPPTGNHPNGSFYSSTTVEPSFFGHKAALERNRMIKEHMPFLYDVLVGAMKLPRENNNIEMGNENDTLLIDPLDPNEAEVMQMEGIRFDSTSVDAAQLKIDKVASSICSMVAFSRNRRINGLQLFNSVRFLASGVTERMNSYLHLLSLTSCRQTALTALRTLSISASRELQEAMAITDSSPMGPSLCIDNLDIEERVHTHSVGHRSMMFHGTWGYIHHPNPKLLRLLDPDQLTIQAYYEALRKVPTMKIDMAMFMPSPEEEVHFEAVLKSQIACVMKQYIAKPAQPAISTKPPPVEPIDPSPPIIQMLKLMAASDNSAEGAGQVIEAVRRQTGLTPEEFVSRVQIVDADLATCKNFNSLRALRAPSRHSDQRLSNLCFLLGASHTMWNISQAILNSHMGNPSSTHDLGVWHTLHALGVPSEKIVPKKDFTSMMNNIEKAHEASIFYCLRVVMRTEHERVPETVPTIPTDKWNQVVEDCYAEFFSPNARRNVSKERSPKLHSFLFRLHDFATVVEANRATKAGDIGRLLSIWKTWSLMSQALPSLVNYRSYLPRMVLLLNHVLPPDLSKLVRHNLLVSPTGRENHFVPKDYFLENQNYWLKFLFNRSGVGTQIDRLQEMFSLNITLLQLMFKDLKLERGGKMIYQSHKNVITTTSLEMFLRMARNYDLADRRPEFAHYHSGVPNVEDYLVAGAKKLLKEMSQNDPKLTRLRMYFFFDGPMNNQIIQEDPTTIERDENETTPNQADPEPQTTEL
ncbi:hypothetical protein PGTUg99_026233 [Puccinia graminis f. sp. tritici]|uniref:DUF6589 domain-containing protein n=1 Tax=Puccinia graminis f. sp. tritici TaxID=56615 RepID=A0A5B0S029_PUCGR|nr:hypothetical protein PGTUg99_026233 [Puccinia graminis f. sp. tritici]